MVQRALSEGGGFAPQPHKARCYLSLTSPPELSPLDFPFSFRKECAALAIYHCSVKIGSRGKGQSAVAAAAYRSGEKLTDKETGLTSDYTRKGGVVFSEISLCENAPAEYADRATLWNAVHQIEKAKDARLWREIEVALPKELSREEQIAAVRDFVKQQTAKGMCADWSLHDKGDGNPHAHIMLTVRSIEPSGKWAPKSRKVYDLDENGERIFQKVDKSGRKQYKSHKEDYNDWNATERVEEWRAAWAECCNARLAERDRIDHRSYERQGIDQIPTVHEGYAARQRVADGLPSDRVQLNDEIRQRNTLLQRIAAQFKTIGEEIKQLIAEQSREKGSAINAGKQRIADLLARRSRAVDSDDRGLADGERATEGRVKKAAPSATDRLIRQSAIERRAASSVSGLEEENSRSTGLALEAPTGRADEQPDTAAIFGAADSLIQDTDTNREAVRAATADTDTTLRQSEATVTSAAANRQERELAEQRRAAEARRRAEEAERAAREASERARKTSHYHGR